MLGSLANSYGIFSGKGSPGKKSDEPETIQVITKDLIRRLRLDIDTEISSLETETVQTASAIWTKVFMVYAKSA